MKKLRNWDNKTWLSSKKYISAFNFFLKKKVKLNKNTKMLSMDIVRGPYDFIVVAEMANFEAFAAVKLAVESTGAVRELVALEAMDLTGAAKKAGELTGNYKAPGQ